MDSGEDSQNLVCPRGLAGLSGNRAKVQSGRENWEMASAHTGSASLSDHMSNFCHYQEALKLQEPSGKGTFRLMCSFLNQESFPTCFPEDQLHSFSSLCIPGLSGLAQDRLKK